MMTLRRAESRTRRGGDVKVLMCVFAHTITVIYDDSEAMRKAARYLCHAFDPSSAISCKLNGSPCDVLFLQKKILLKHPQVHDR